MTVFIAPPPYCPNCTCESCMELRYPETPEEAGRRMAREVFDEFIKTRPMSQADLD